MSRFRRIIPVSDDEDSIEERMEPSNVSDISNHSIATLNDTTCSYGSELEPDVSMGMVDESHDKTESDDGDGEEQPQSQLKDSQINGK